MISEAECGERSSNFRESRMDFDFRGKLKDRHGSAFSTDVSDEEDFSSGDEEDVENGKKRKHENCPKTKDQLDRRRERNRVLARKTRLRKKSFFEVIPNEIEAPHFKSHLEELRCHCTICDKVFLNQTLQKQVALLAIENDMLKGIVRQRLGGSKSASSVKNAPLGSAEVALSSSRASAILEHADDNVMAAIQAAQRSYTITDPSLPDNPIIFASKGFLELTGYSLENTLGRNCRFLQGPGTDMSQVETLSESIKAGKDSSVCLLNYRADGTPFFNQMFVAAIRDPAGAIMNYVGVQVEIKSLLDPNSSIDLEDFCINKIPKKGRPRTRELKEPKIPKNKDLKEQKELKSKVPPGPKSPFKSLPKKALGNITSDKKSSVPSSLTSNSASIQMYEVKEELQLMNRLTECGNVSIISAANSPKLIMKKRPIHKISGKPDYYDQSDLSSINEVSEKSDTDIDIVASMECSQTFSTYASGGGFANGKRSDSSGTLDSTCTGSGSGSSEESVKSSDDGSYDNYSVLRRSRSNGGHTINANGNGSCVGVNTTCDSFHGIIDMNMSIGSMTSINGGGGLLSNQTIDELFFMFGRDHEENEVDNYMFQFGEEEVNKGKRLESSEYSNSLLSDPYLPQTMSEDDTTWNFY